MHLHHDRIQTAARILRPKLSAFLDRAGTAGYRILVVRVWESPEAQWLKYQQGRELNRETGEWEVVDRAKVVTDAQPGQSGHNLIDEAGEPASMAIDVIPLDPEDQPLWGLPGESAMSLEARWRATVGRSQQAGWGELYRIASRCGLDPYGDEWGAVLKWDKGHFEEPAYWLMLEALGIRRPTWPLRSEAA